MKIKQQKVTYRRGVQLYQKFSLFTKPVMNHWCRPSLVLQTLSLSLPLTMGAVAFAESTETTTELSPSHHVKTALRRQVDKVITELKTLSPSARVSERLDRIGPSLILKMGLKLEETEPQGQATEFIKRMGGIWGHLNVSVDKIESRRGRHIVHLVGSIDGTPILNQQSKLSIVNQHAQHLSNGLGAIDELIKAKVTKEIAVKAALRSTEARGLKLLDVKRYAVSYEPGVAHEVFQVRLSDPSTLRTWSLLIDGQEGGVIKMSEGELR